MLPKTSFLSVSLLFFILTVSLAFIVFSYPNILRPVLRRDPVLGNGYVIPWARPSPSIDDLSRTPLDKLPWDLHTTMTGALVFDITYRIDVPNGTRTVPGKVYLAHDSTYLYVGGIFRGMYTNPTSDAIRVYANHFTVLFDVNNDGMLTSPESGSTQAVYVYCPIVQDACHQGGWTAGTASSYIDQTWVDYSTQLYPARGVWDLAQNICQQPFAVGNYIDEYDNNTGTMVLLFSRRLSLPGSCANALQMRPGERWAMGFLLELGYSNKYEVYKDFVDGWPMKAYPYLTNDASWWPKLVIDLANPPSGFSG